MTAQFVLSKYQRIKTTNTNQHHSIFKKITQRFTLTVAWGNYKLSLQLTACTAKKCPVILSVAEFLIKKILLKRLKAYICFEV